MPTRTLSYDVIARDVNASRTFSQIGASAEKSALVATKSASTATTAFETSTNKIGRSLSSLGNTAASFGVPFASSLAIVGDHFETATAKSRTFGSTISRLGGVELLAGAAGLALIGKSAVNAATDFETSQARLQTAVGNT